jgi:SAM-dependent methyltransferase
MSSTEESPRYPDPASAVVAAALRVDPIRRAVMALGRSRILQEAKKIGVPWESDVAALTAQIATVLEPLRAALEDPFLANVDNLPAYYKQPFHGYPKGNLGYLPALEAEVSSRTVHAKFCQTEPLRGDGSLRGTALDILCARWEAVHGAVRGPPAAILDIGCSVGLSAAGLASRFPEARVVGVDATAHMLAVGALRRPEVEYVHALGEALPRGYAASFDIVSLQLVVHELPDQPTRAILLEAARVLRPGGMICVMDVDPSAFADVPVVVQTLFRSTEPFFEDHSRRDIEVELFQAGFRDIENGFNTPRHRTYTAFTKSD